MSIGILQHFGSREGGSFRPFSQRREHPGNRPQAQVISRRDLFTKAPAVSMKLTGTREFMQHPFIRSYPYACEYFAEDWVS
jgi:hypothetical protein